MSERIGTYTFLPWIRQGIANRIGSSATTLRPTVDVRVDLEGTSKSGGSLPAQAVQRAVELYGQATLSASIGHR
jgi:hypothetical protein